MAQTIEHTFDLDLVLLWLSHQERSRLTVQRICRIGIAQKLREEHFKDIDHIEHRGPCLVNDIQAHASASMRLEPAVHYSRKLGRDMLTVRRYWGGKCDLRIQSKGICMDIDREAQHGPSRYLQ